MGKYIEAHIQQENDITYYPVRLLCVPRVGELIDLYSSLDAASGHDPYHRYEVTQVVHKVHDVKKGDPTLGEGHHFVTVWVRESSSNQ